jgi:hypothetical protein
VKRPSHATKKKKSKTKQLNLFVGEKKNEEKRVPESTSTDSSGPKGNGKSIPEREN